MSTKKTRSEAPQASSVGEQVVEGLRTFRDTLRDENAGGEAVEKRFTVRRVKLDLRPPDYAAADVRRVRRELQASQSVFARLLGVSASTVRAWERGERIPSPMARRLLHEIRTDRERWRRRLREASVQV